MHFHRLHDRGTHALLQAGAVREHRHALKAHGARSGETITGDKSIADLNDLLANYNGQISQMSQAYASFLPAWLKNNPAEWGAWSSDWLQFLTRYNLAKRGAELRILKNKMIPLPDSVQSASDEYETLLRAVQPVPGSVTKGSFADLRNRFTKAFGRDVTTAMQPKAPDLRAAAQERVASAPLGQPGGAAAPPVGDWIREWFDKNKSKLILIGVGLGALLVLPPILGLVFATPRFSPSFYKTRGRPRDWA
jgi:hypothetical protein